MGIAAALALATVAGLPTRVALAQVVIPPGVEPGQIQRQLREMRTPQATAHVDVPPAPEQPVPEAASTLKFTLRGVDVAGNSVYGTAGIAKAFEPLIGREIAVAEVFRVANALTARYRSDGYVLSQVLVPAQNITDGRVQVMVVEGFIESVQYRGNVPENNAQLASMARKIERERPITAAHLERYLLLMNDLGGTVARGTIVPADNTQGAANLLVDFSRRFQQLALTTDSRNSRSLGPYRATGTQDWYSVVGEWDRFTVRSGSSFNSRLNFAGLGYSAPLGGDGARWTLNGNYVRSNPAPAANLQATDLRTRSVSGSLELSYPLLRSRTSNLYLRGTLASFDGRSELIRTDISDDHIRSARIGLNFDLADAWRGVNMLDLEYSQGLKGLGARDTGTDEAPLSRADGRADYSKATLYAARLQSLGGPWTGLLAFTVQQSFTPLLAPEQFAMGGEPFGRGYDPAEIVGDSGEAAKLELRFSAGRPHASIPPYSLYGFYDWGRVRRRNALNQEPTEDASSCGFGIRMSGFGNRWQAFFEVAKPLDHEVAARGNERPRVFFGIQIAT